MAPASRPSSTSSPAPAGRRRGSSSSTVRTSPGSSVPERARLGMGRTFQNLSVAREMSVIENVALGAARFRNYGTGSALLGLRRVRHIGRGGRAAGPEGARRPGDRSLAGVAAGDLPHGHLRRLELARALALGPGSSCSTSPPPAWIPVETAAAGRGAGGHQGPLGHHDPGRRTRPRPCATVAEDVFVLDFGRARRRVRWPRSWQDEDVDRSLRGHRRRQAVDARAAKRRRLLRPDPGRPRCQLPSRTARASLCWAGTAPGRVHTAQAHRRRGHSGRRRGRWEGRGHQPASPRSSGSGRASCSCPKAGGLSPTLPWKRTSFRRLLAADRSGGRRTSSWTERMTPSLPSWPAEASPGRQPLRRGTADAGDRAGPHGRPETPAPRRTVPRPGPQGGGVAL